MTPPLLILGVRRSGTTLLRVMLDRNPQLAVPDESYFIPQLAARHGGRFEPEEFLDDLGRIATLREWGVGVEDVRSRLGENMDLGDAIGAVFDAYAARRGKSRWGDKTPLYMQYLGLLERLFPQALFVHLIRDGRDAALSYLAVPAGIMTESFGHPRDATGFACQWRTEVGAARALGRRAGPERYLEVRYESLVDDPETELRGICNFAALPYEQAMLEYTGSVDVSDKAHQQSLRKPPTPGLRDWRTEMSADDITAFERIAGDLLMELGYPLSKSETFRLSVPARARLTSYRAKTGAWRATGRLVQRSPLWRRRHPPLASPASSHPTEPPANR